MATELTLRHRDTGLAAKAYTGFSWTTALFGPFPALFRADYITFLVYVAVVAVALLVTVGIALPFIVAANVVWGFLYNANHLRRLIEKGYVLADGDATNVKAQQAAKMSASAMGLRPEPAELTNDAYKIYLVRKYKIERNDALQKVIVKDRLFDTTEDALVFADREDRASMPEPPPAPAIEKWRQERKIVRSFRVQGKRFHWLDDGTVAFDGCDDAFDNLPDAQARATSST
jgi:hypothetical protein